MITDGNDCDIEPESGNMSKYDIIGEYNKNSK